MTTAFYAVSEKLYSQAAAQNQGAEGTKPEGEPKVDENGNLFLRLSKEDAIDEKINIVDSGDSIHLKIKIAAYPAKKEVAINKLKEAIDL